MKPAYLQTLLFTALMCTLASCTSDFQSNPRVQAIWLNKNIYNSTYGHKQIYYKISDSTSWARTWNAQDTTIQDGAHLKFRSNRIWYEMTETPTGYRANQQYPGWERAIDSIDRKTNIMVLRNNHRVKIEVPAADVVLGGDSVRIAIIRTTGPAFAWTHRDYKPQPDQLLLTTPGKDTMHIAYDMESLGPVNRQTVFRVGQHEYILRYIGEDYEKIVIEKLEDGRGYSLTAELDLSYRQVQVKDLDGNLTHIKRTPGKDLYLYFWGGFNGEERLLQLDSLYKAAPPDRRDAFDLVAISRFSTGGSLETLIEKHDISLPMYLGTEKTCLRLNCTGYLPYLVQVNGRGKIVNFHEWSNVVEERLSKRATLLPDSSR